ncbi:MAG: transcription antitermination factor NusB [Actinomycetales bacterium]|nr:transcription antitermination factor NusB [Actinomycetales bacterium]
MRTRSKARSRAVEALFEAEQRGVSAQSVLDRNPEVNEYATELVELVSTNLERIDEIISTYLADRTIARMPAIDRAIARVAVAELVWQSELDTSVIVAEAMEIGELLSTEQSAKFLNGLLGSIAKSRTSFTSL